ncbi:hypothetical protein [Listeria fleischmannii]|uniref:Phage protein n=1 Tax=Listeria fleischmannii FSL S10-1203 TaxID=1265822 RepID=W7DX59_9LIST|nr:hypothetical protein [Listeria fleischmannii]EUJ64831.1 phage protein [Listeria fleischmannii FSL S10-1203]
MVDVNNQNQEHELGWDDTIERESTFVLLPEGDYDFTVTKMTRGRYDPKPNSKIPACNMAKLELTIHSHEHGDQTILHNLYLHTQTEGLLSAFFVGIGQKKKGEPLKMDWNNVVGATGRAKIKINQYMNQSGEERQNNQVARFYEPENYNQPTAQQPPQQSQQQYQPGMF